MSFNEIIDTLNRQGHNFSFNQVPKKSSRVCFLGRRDKRKMFSYFQAHTYLGSDSLTKLPLANQNRKAGSQRSFPAWAQVNFRLQRTPTQQHAD